MSSTTVVGLTYESAAAAACYRVRLTVRVKSIAILYDEKKNNFLRLPEEHDGAPPSR